LTAKGKKEDDFDRIINNRKDFLTGGRKLNKKDTDIQKKVSLISLEGDKYWSALEKVLWRNFLWKDLSTPTTSKVTLENYSRLRIMAIAYSTRGAKLSGNKKLRDDIIYALDWLYKNQYNEKLQNKGDWYDYEVSIPLVLNDILILMSEDLSKSQNEKYCKSIFSFNPDLWKIDKNKENAQGAVLALKSFIYALSGSLLKSPQKIDFAIAGLNKSLKYTESGEGFYKDGSFIENEKHPYSGAIAIDYLTSVVNLLYVLQNTSWEASVKEKENVKEWLMSTFYPIIYKDNVLDMFRGREVAIPGSEDKRLHQLIINGVGLTQIFGSDSLIHNIVSELVNYVELNELFNNCSVKTILLIKELESDKSFDQPQEEKTGIKIYPEMDRVVVKRPGYSFGISMFSERIYNYECIEEVNLKGWYTGYGMTYLYHASYYPQIFWPTINPYRLPGTTVAKIDKGLAERQSQVNKMKFVGGAEIDGQFGVIGMEFEDVGTSLKARKSWFLFDNEIVALGSDIRCKEKLEVETILENRKVDPFNTALIINGMEDDLEELSQEAYSNIEWMHMRSKSDTIGIGYFFPKYYNVNLTIERRKGSWSEINKNIKDTSSIVDSYFTAGFNHGFKPSSGNYQYVIVPNITSEDMRKYDQNPEVVILENNARVQAAKDSKLNLIAANFWTNHRTTLSVDGHLVIICDQPVSILFREKEDEIEIALSDPSQENSGVLNLEIVNSNIVDLTEAYNGLTFLNTDDIVKLSIDLNNSKGRSLSFKFKRKENKEKQ